MTNMLFLFLFLPISLIIYHLSGRAVKEYVLLIVSLLFYSVCSPEYIALFVIAIAVTARPFLTLEAAAEYCRLLHFFSGAAGLLVLILSVKYSTRSNLI